MLERSKRYQNDYMAKQIVSDAKRDMINETPTPEQVIRYMIEGEYVVYKYEDKSKRTLVNRLNLLWVWPLVVMCIPFQYLLTGKTGVTRSSKIGRIVDWLIRFD